MHVHMLVSGVKLLKEKMQNNREIFFRFGIWVILLFPSLFYAVFGHVCMHFMGAAQCVYCSL